MKDWMAKLIEGVATKFAGRLVTKAVTALASILVTHALMKPEQQGAWILTNADWLTGLVLSGISLWLSSYQHAAHQQALDTAAITGAGPTVQAPVTLKPGAGPGADIPAGGDRQ